MSFELLKHDAEVCLQAILVEHAKKKKIRKALLVVRNNYPDRKNFHRILEHLCSKGYMKKEIYTVTNEITNKNERRAFYDITYEGERYFLEKEEYMKGQKQMFMKLPSNSRKLLQEILDAENPTQMVGERFEYCSDKEDEEFRSLIRELSQEGYITIPKWADNVPLYIEINDSARTYAEREAEYERQIKLAPSTTYNIGSITAKGSNLVLGDVANSYLSINSSIKHIACEIEEKGGEDKEALFALLEEAKKLIDNIETKRQIPRNKGFFNRLSSHLEKHGWFYGEIIGLLGTALLGTLR